LVSRWGGRWLLSRKGYIFCEKMELKRRRRYEEEFE